MRNGRLLLAFAAGGASAALAITLIGTVANVSASTRYDDLSLFTNVLKHSGARKVDVFTHAGAGRASIVIEDDGRGFDVAARRNGRGLANLQERAREAGGTLVVESEPGRGTRATLALPAG